MQYEDDSIYINSILNGQTGVFAALVDKHKSKAYAIAFRLLKNREEAEEVAQDSFLKVYRSLNTFRGDAKFSTWLYRIIYNEAISILRKKKHQINSYDDENFEWMEPIETVNELDRLEQSDRKKFVEEALSRLEEEDATIVSLFYHNDCTVDEISEITGLGQSNVKVKLFRARKKLYEELNQLLKTEINQLL